MRTADFDYPLPPELIAQEPAPQRDQSRLLVLHRHDGHIEHRHFADLPEFLRPGDVLVLNDSRVIPARLRGTNARTGGEFEILLLEQNAPNDWWTMMRPGKRARIGTDIVLRTLAGEVGAAQARVVEINAEGHRRLVFTGVPDITAILDRLGEVPLPPYIGRAAPNRRDDDRERYQTVYARAAGSVAAPTAGLHFTEALLERIRARGVEICCVTLHVGLGTFAPVKVERLDAHVMHEERFTVALETVRAIKAAKEAGRRVVAVGTTSVRVLESFRSGDIPVAAGCEQGRQECRPSDVRPPEGGTTNGRTRIFIHPPFAVRVADALVTNFHLPCSTLLMLVGAFAAPGEVRGRELMLGAYAQAVSQRYRFFSYGDAMLIL